jgi:hypothetical protein
MLVRFVDALCEWTGSLPSRSFSCSKSTELHITMEDGKTNTTYRSRFLFINTLPPSTRSLGGQVECEKLKNRHAQIQSMFSRIRGVRSSWNSTQTGVVFAHSQVTSAGKKTKTEFKRKDSLSPVGRSRAYKRPLLPAQQVRICHKSQSQAAACDRRVGPRPERIDSCSSELESLRDSCSNSTERQPSLVELADEEYRCLQRYLSGLHKTFLQSAGLSPVECSVPLLESAASMVQASLEYSFLLYGLLAHVSTALAKADPKGDSKIMLSASDAYCHKAVAALRTRLSTSIEPDHHVIVGLWHLISAELNRADFEIARTHLYGANAIILHVQKTGQDLRPPYVTLIRACESKLAITTWSDERLLTLWSAPKLGNCRL